MLISIGQPSKPEDLVTLLLECHLRIRTFVQLAVDVGRRGDLPDRDVVDACQRCDRYFTEALPLHVEDEEQSVLPRLKGLRADVDSALETMHSQHQGHEPLLKDLLAGTHDVRTAPGDRPARERLRLAASRLSAEFGKHLSMEEEVRERRRRNI